jgi:hypothetical protein
MYKTKVFVYVNNDNGKYVGLNKAKLRDNVRFSSKTVKASSIPMIPKKKHILTLTLK